jgi:Response regulator containing a CheY-like receiver domain and an HTH DNA-binding domain
MGQQVADAVRLIRTCGEDDRGEQLPQALLNGLNALVPGMCVCFSELDLLRRSQISFQSSEPALDDDEDEDAFWRVYPQLRPCHYLYDGNLTRPDVVLLSDFIPYGALINSALYQDYLLPSGERYAMFVPLPTTPGRTRVLVFSRWDRDYTDADRDLLTLLQPHLRDAHHAHQQRQAGTPTLTQRQWQVLHCLANGLSTEQVAAAMCVSPSTVRKHLENIYERLGVTNRAAAIGTAFASQPAAVAAVAG